MSRTTLQRLAALGVLVVVVVALAVVLTGGDSYTIHGRFTDAGLLIKGGQVKVGGRNVGSVGDISVTDDGIADVTLDLHGSEVVPLHVGTRATIRSLGLATITNHYVDLAPGSPSAAKLPDGAVLPTTQTTGLVSLDALLDAFDAPSRANLEDLLANSAHFFAGSGAPAFNRMLAQLSPATRELGGVASDLAADQSQLAQLVHKGQVAATTIAQRRPELRQAIDTSGQWLTAVADQRASLAKLLQQAPQTLTVGRRTLDDAGKAVARLRPALRAIPAAAGPLAAFVAQAGPAVHDAGPVAEHLSQQLPDVRRTIAGLRPLARQGVPALRAAGAGLKVLQPIFRGLRIYAPDFALGIINGLAGVSASNYAKVGHYARLEFIQNLQTTIGGAFAKTLTGHELIPGITNVRTGLTGRCPGADAPPAPDGSSPINATDLCNPADDTPLSVDQPPGTGR